MTVTTIQSGRKMRWICRIFTGGCRTIMTGIAAGIDAYCAVVEGRAGKAARVMTNATILTGRYVSGRFPGGISTVMAGRAIIHDTLMVKRGRQETGGQVTLTAIRIGGYMGEGFARGRRAVMTGRAVIDDTGVVKASTGKSSGVMTVGTIPGITAQIQYGNVIRCQAGGIGAIVARCAVIHDALVIKDRGRESTGHVADTTVFVGRQVRYTGPGQFVILASGRQATVDVTRIAACVLYLGTIMIDIRISEVAGVMANTTILVGHRMCGCLASNITI